MRPGRPGRLPVPERHGAARRALRRAARRGRAGRHQHPPRAARRCARSAPTRAPACSSPTPPSRRPSRRCSTAWASRRSCGTAAAAPPAGRRRYADLLARGSDDPLPWTVDDEDATISINYTSGTTGDPEGRDVHPPRRLPERAGREHHRTATGRTPSTCGRCRCSTATAGATRGRSSAAGGAQVCLRAVRGDAIWALIDEEGVTHLCGAPAVLSVLVNDPSRPPARARRSP